MILGLAMSGEDLAGIIISALIILYLVYALIFPEKL
jgi:K+-transporting ATPase KdpF subunit